MSSNQHSNSRASLLSGLRTGGVRNASFNVPHTAAPNAGFNIPRYASQGYYESEEEDQFYDLADYNSRYAPTSHGHGHPMTAAVDGPRFQQQQKGLNPHSAPFNPSFGGQNHIQQQQQQIQAQQQAFQMQLMQLELLKIQHAQQQYQAELLAQAQAQRQGQVDRRANLGYGAPATAAVNGAFDIRSVAANAQLRRGSQDVVPQTAAIGGRFGNRTASAVNPNEMADRYSPPATTVISGGIALGNTQSNVVTPPSKSDSASSWRRGSNSVLRDRTVTSPSKASTGRAKPQPLQFNSAVGQGIPVVAIDDADEGSSSDSSKNSGSSPTTPRSSSSTDTPLSPREEASRKLYEGLGMGRPKSNVSSTGLIIPSVTINDVNVDPLPSSYRLASSVVRQPRGPPSGADELGPQNFASRIRRQAIGGLDALREARERRELVEAY